MTEKQQKFVDAYLGEARFNATRAAEIAGYSSPMQRGYDAKNDPEVAEEIRNRLASSTMSSNEVLARLSDHASGTLEHFVVTSGDGERIHFDLNSDEAKTHFHLIKKLKTERRRGGKQGEEWETEKVEIELHDPQAALVQIGRHHKLFTDKIENSLDERDRSAIDSLNSKLARIASRTGADIVPPEPDTIGSEGA